MQERVKQSLDQVQQELVEVTKASQFHDSADRHDTKKKQALGKHTWVKELEIDG